MLSVLPVSCCQVWADVVHVFVVLYITLPIDPKDVCKESLHYFIKIMHICTAIKLSLWKVNPFSNKREKVNSNQEFSTNVVCVF